jgi:hypothetical protein
MDREAQQSGCCFGVSDSSGSGEAIRLTTIKMYASTTRQNARHRSLLALHAMYLRMY